ncbi:sigma-70 family RNA polymerase sigma factor [Lactobacillus gasseri]|uniref:sigma-70 family RNA polymerase sigma factor n=1 Tax=Lactobacillus gasseri TaxID=1596 RepID=UPI0002770243|nr:sigma-70 family RNA polymerase sigma factor [Lactobacillus gasseri]EJN54161.1 DNA-directed RNA polymerase specialized sigma subunit [Lactobacillus gasseri CECT 5714]MBV6740503.1 sigma-70 family RNA polymerase sigma factor [Lactobacillus gasseri CECT 5714]WEA88066.1 sigma-70 family RNA polymerase sigma factor [Lactobacillus gasseri]
MFHKKLDYVFVSENKNGIVVRVKATGETITVTKSVGNIILDMSNDQYNSDHRFERHQDRFFASDPKNPNIDPLTELRDRSSIEVTSAYGNEYLLDSIITVEDAVERQRLIDQLPDALATLTDRQRYVVTRYYCDQIKKKEIAKEIGISAVMVGRHAKAAITKLRRFYKVAEK